MKAVYRWFVMFAALGMFSSCGPVVITARPQYPPPPWFYPHRLEVVRYVYFPEYNIYYDLSVRSYLYFDNGGWIRANTLPPHLRHLDLNRSRYERIHNYQGDDIAPYHNDHNLNRGRSNRDTSPARTRVPNQ